MNLANANLRNPQTLVILLALGVFASFVVFHQSLFELVRRWNTQEEYSHGYFIPFITLWLLWSRRQVIAASFGEPSWVGPLIILLTAAMHIVGELTALWILSQVSFVLVLMGIVLGVGGFRLLRVVFIPIVFLLFAIPLPYFIDTVLSWRLMLISSELGVFFIRLFGVPVFLEGNVIDLGVYKLQVVEACSGLRYLYPLLSLGFLAAYLFQAPFWKRAIVFLSTIPITIVMNSFRIGMVGIVVNRFGPQDADGALHFFEGWIIFIACAGLLGLEILLLARIGSKQPFFTVFRVPTLKMPEPRERQLRGGLKPIVAALALLITSGLAAYHVSGRQEIMPERVRFATFPTTIGDWRGRVSSMDPQVEHFLALSDYILSDYVGPDRKAVNFYVAYYASQRKGNSPHSPSVCIPGNGWQISRFERSHYESTALQTKLPINRVTIEKGNRKQLVYYWFEQRGRKIENEWWSKWYLLVDSIVMNRTDGALVRLTTLVYPGEEEADAERRLQAFTDKVLPTMSAYLPAEKDRARSVAANSN